MAEGEATPKWEDMYGEVVWAKAMSFPWWPCYVYDPVEVPGDKEVVLKAAKNKYKQHCIYYYGDKSYGFVPLKSIKPYDEVNRAIFGKQKVNKAYQASFALAMDQADVDVLLPKRNRVSWHIPVVHEEVKVEKKLKIKRPVVESEGGEIDPEERDLFDTMESSGLYFHEDELDDEEEEEPVSEEESDVASEDSEPVLLAKKRKSKVSGDADRPVRDERTTKKRRLVKGSAAAGPDSAQKQAKSLLGKKATPSKTRGSSAEPVTPVVDFKQESRMDRLERLVKIMGLCVKLETLDEARAVKTIEKIGSMNLTYDELRDSGVGMLVHELRKHMSTKIAEVAKRVRNEWKEKVKSGEAGTPAVTPKESNNRSEEASQMQATADAVPVAAPTTTSGSAADSSPRNRLMNHKTVAVPTPAAPVIPAEVSSNQVRSNAVRLLQSTLASLPAAVRCESAIERLYGQQKRMYFECVSRCASQLQKPEGGALKDLCSKSSASSISTDGTSELSRWLVDSIPLVSV